MFTALFAMVGLILAIMNFEADLVYNYYDFIYHKDFNNLDAMKTTRFKGKRQ